LGFDYSSTRSRALLSVWFLRFETHHAKRTTHHGFWTHHAPRNTLLHMDGHLQRQALTAAERAIEALGRKDPGGARSAVSTAVEKDQIGLFSALADAVHLAATELERDGELTEATWNTLADAVGPGPLQGLVDSFRG
jgi:hypothetical protein